MYRISIRRLRSTALIQARACTDHRSVHSTVRFHGAFRVSLSLSFSLSSDFLCSWLHYLLCAAAKYGHPLPLSLSFSSFLFPRHFAMRRSLSMLFCSTVEERIGRGLKSAGCLTERACHKLTGAWNTTKRRLSASASDSITVNHSKRRPCLSLQSPPFHVVKFHIFWRTPLNVLFFSSVKSQMLNPSVSYKTLSIFFFSISLSLFLSLPDSVSSAGMELMECLCLPSILQ